MSVSESVDRNDEKANVPVIKYRKDDSIEKGMRINPTTGVIKRFETGEITGK